MPVTPHVRELRAKALTYGRVIAAGGPIRRAHRRSRRWSSRRDLEQKVAEAKRKEVSHVGKKPREPGPTARAAAHREGPAGRLRVERGGRGDRRAPS